MIRWLISWLKHLICPGYSYECFEAFQVLNFRIQRMRVIKVIADHILQERGKDWLLFCKLMDVPAVSGDKIERCMHSYLIYDAVENAVSKVRDGRPRMNHGDMEAERCPCCHGYDKMFRDHYSQKFAFHHFKGMDHVDHLIRRYFAGGKVPQDVMATMGKLEERIMSLIQEALCEQPG